MMKKLHQENVGGDHNNTLNFSFQNKKPEWLLSDYNAPYWVIKNIGSINNSSINFDVVMPDGSRLLEHENLIETIRRVVYSVRSSNMIVIESGEVQANLGNNLINIACWMNLKSIDNFSQLTRFDIEQFIEEIPYGWNVALNNETRLIEHLSELFFKAKIHDNDEIDVRKNKALSVFPFIKHKEREIFIDRYKLLEQAGMNRSCISGKGAEDIVKLLDQANYDCGFYMSPDVHERFNNPIITEEEDEPLTKTSIVRILNCFDYLYVYRRLLDDTITFNPFVGSSPIKRATAIGKAVGRTHSIPIKQGITMIERSIRWVLNYSDDIIELVEGYNQIHRRYKSLSGIIPNAAKLLTNFSPKDSGFGAPWPLTGFNEFHTSGLWSKFQHYDGISLIKSVKYLQVACAVVIASFSARRAREIIGLEEGCVKKIDDDYWMEIFIHKTLQVKDKIPVPEVVDKAINVLERLSKDAREINNDPRIFQFTSALGSWNANTTYGDFSTNLTEFGLYLDIPEYKGERWLFKPHQFRRFFAIIYIHVYSEGSYEALSYHLRHFNIEMTMRYTQDDEIGAILRYAQKEKTVQIIKDSVLLKTSLAGEFGQRLSEAAKRLYDRLQKTVQIVTEEYFEYRIVKFVERLNLDLNANPWGYCAAKKESSTPCAMSESGRHEASSTHCKDCVFNANTEELLPLWQEALTQHELIVNNPETPSILKAASEKRINEIRQFKSGFTI